MPEVLERLKEKLPPFLIYQIEDQYRRLSDLDMQIDGIEKQLAAWAKQKKRRPTSVAVVGMANKIARTVWALVAHNRTYDKKHVSVRPF